MFTNIVYIIREGNPMRVALPLNDITPMSAVTDAAGLKSNNADKISSVSTPLMYKALPLGNYTGLSFSPSFGSTLKTFETKKSAIKEGLNNLGKEQVVLIMHGSSFPSISSADTGYGSPNSSGARELIDFISGVFTGIQFGPGGKTKSCDSSPYTSTLFSSNPLFVDLEQLTKPEWGSIFPEKEFNSVVQNNLEKDKARTNYEYIFKAQELALKIAYKNFMKGDSPRIKELKQEFELYKADDANNPWLENDALYEALSKKHNMDYWPLWDDELDKNLIAKKNTKEGRERIAEIKRDYADEIDFYKFVQFVYSKQIADTKEYANSKGVKLIADKQVAFSDRDIWAYQDLFLEGWNLGCPPDYFAADGQTWGFPVVNPEKLFNPDGSLGEAGEILKKSITKIFKEHDMLRIDHYLGLVDPWVYPGGNTASASAGAGRLYSSPHIDKLKKYSIIDRSNADDKKIADNIFNGNEWSETDYVDGSTLSEEQLDKYSLYIDKIILAAVRDALIDPKDFAALQEKAEDTSDPKGAARAKARLDRIEDKIRNSIIAEDLGSVTTPAKVVMEKMGLNGIKIAQFMDGADKNSPYLPTAFKDPAQANYWYMAGSHDNQPLSLWAEDAIKSAGKSLEDAKDEDKGKIKAARANINYIADYLYKNDEHYEELKERLFKDPKFLTQSVYALILKSPAKNIQIFFSDLFGERRIYNVPGTSPQLNWSVRAENDFRSQYSRALSNDAGFDFVKAEKTALKSRMQDS